MGKMLDKLNEYLDNATQEELQETYNKLSHLLCKDNSTIDDDHLRDVKKMVIEKFCEWLRTDAPITCPGSVDELVEDVKQMFKEE